MHHGIKGQKWGVRRFQNYDGTLINKKGHQKKKTSELTEEERKARNRKIAKAVAIGAGVALTAYAGHKAYEQLAPRYLDKTLNNKKIYTVSLDDNKESYDNIYASFKKQDAMGYKGWYANQLFRRADSDPDKYGKRDKVVQIIHDVKDMKIASEKSASNVFAEMYNSDGEFKEYMDDLISSASVYSFLNPAMAAKRPVINKAKKGDMKAMYNIFNSYGTMDIGADSDFSKKSSQFNKAFNSALKAKGYAGLYDINDFTLGNARAPIIIFDKSKMSNKAVKDVTRTQANLNGTAFLLDRSISDLAVPAGLGAALVGSADVLRKTSDKNNKDKKQEVNQNDKRRN